MISLFQAIIAFILLGLGAFYYFKTRSTPKSKDFDPLEDVKAEPAKPTPAVAGEHATDLEPEVIVTPALLEPENEDIPVKPTPTTTPAKSLVPEKPKPVKPTPTTTPAPEPEPEPEPEAPTPTTTPAKPLVSPKPIGPTRATEFRMGWPRGTKWNLRGATGNDTQMCNDICKSLGYNYFTHNPPPHDGGCGCSRSSKKLSQLNMTDHVNAKTRRVV